MLVSILKQGQRGQSYRIMGKVLAMHTSELDQSLIPHVVIQTWLGVISQ